MAVKATAILGEGDMMVQTLGLILKKQQSICANFSSLTFPWTCEGRHEEESQATM